MSQQPVTAIDLTTHHTPWSYISLPVFRDVTTACHRDRSNNPPHTMKLHFAPCVQRCHNRELLCHDAKSSLTLINIVIRVLLRCAYAIDVCRNSRVCVTSFPWKRTQERKTERWKVKCCKTEFTIDSICEIKIIEIMWITDEWMNGWMDEWMHGWINVLMDRWTDEWMDKK